MINEHDTPSNLIRSVIETKTEKIEINKLDISESMPTLSRKKKNKKPKKPSEVGQAETIDDEQLEKDEIAALAKQRQNQKKKLRKKLKKKEQAKIKEVLHQNPEMDNVRNTFDDEISTQTYR